MCTPVVPCSCCALVTPWEGQLTGKDARGSWAPCALHCDVHPLMLMSL